MATRTLSRSQQQAQVRALVDRVVEASAEPKYVQRKDMWTRHHRLEKVAKAPVYVGIYVIAGNYPVVWQELIPPETLISQDPLERDIELQLRQKLCKHDHIPDDDVMLPTVWIRPVRPAQLASSPSMSRERERPGSGARLFLCMRPTTRAAPTRLAEGMDPLVIVNQGLVPGMDVVGEKFKNEEYYMPDMLVSARAMKTAMAILRPLLVDREGATLGQVVIGTVKGDLHDIGKNLVTMMLEGAGFEINDLGADVTPDDFVKAVEENKARILCLSALLTTTMPMMQTTIEKLSDSELRQNVKVMVGGAPVTQGYASQIGADGYAEEAASAVQTAKELIGIPIG